MSSPNLELKSQHFSGRKNEVSTTVPGNRCDYKQGQIHLFFVTLFNTAISLKYIYIENNKWYH